MTNDHIDENEQLILKLSAYIGNGIKLFRLNDGLVDEIHRRAILIQRKNEKNLQKKH